MSRRPDHLLLDCPTCRVEGALIELYGEPAEGRCRVCGHTTADGRLVHVGRRLRSVEDVEEALRAWAAEEGEPDVNRFVRGNFIDGTVAAVADRLLDGEPVATNFDVLGWLMPGLGGGANVRTGPPIVDTPDVALPPLETTAAPRDPKAAAEALRALAWADGTLHPAERAFLDAAGVPHDRPVVTRPTEVGIPEAPEQVVRDLIRLALADGVVDQSEVRVIREFARAWGVAFDTRLLPLGGTMQRAFTSVFASLFG